LLGCMLRGAFGQGALKRVLALLACAVVLLELCNLRYLRAEPHIAKIIGLGASTCSQFNEDIKVNPSLQKDYFAWSQGYMSGILITRQPGVDEELNLNPTSFDLTIQLQFLRDYCAANTSANFADAVLELYKRLRREGKT